MELANLMSSNTPTTITTTTNKQAVYVYLSGDHTAAMSSFIKKIESLVLLKNGTCKCLGKVDNLVNEWHVSSPDMKHDIVIQQLGQNVSSYVPNHTDIIFPKDRNKGQFPLLNGFLLRNDVFINSGCLYRDYANIVNHEDDIHYDEAAILDILINKTPVAILSREPTVSKIPETPIVKAEVKAELKPESKIKTIHIYLLGDHYGLRNLFMSKFKDLIIEKNGVFNISDPVLREVHVKLGNISTKIVVCDCVSSGIVCTSDYRRENFYFVFSELGKGKSFLLTNESDRINASNNVFFANSDQYIRHPINAFNNGHPVGYKMAEAFEYIAKKVEVSITSESVIKAESSLRTVSKTAAKDENPLMTVSKTAVKDENSLMTALKRLIASKWVTFDTKLPNKDFVSEVCNLIDITQPDFQLSRKDYVREVLQVVELLEK